MTHIEVDAGEFLGGRQPYIDTIKPCVNGVDHGTGDVAHHPAGWCRECGPVPPRAEVLREAERLTTGDRNVTYGSPTANFQNTADLWTVLLAPLLKDGVRLEPRHVADLMVALKLARNMAEPKRDNFVDIAGYAACGYETTVEAGNER